MSEPQQDPKPEMAIAKRPGDMGVIGAAVEIKTLDDMRWLCGTLAKSSMVPTAYKNKPEDIFVCIQHGSELGLKPLQALSAIAVINGRPTLYGDGLPALLWASGELEDLREYVETVNGEMHAVCVMKRRGAKTPIEATFSESDAKAAGLLNKAGPWTQYKRRMLQMRARSWCARDGFADVLRGLHVREEVLDYEPRQTPQERRTIELTPDGRIAAEPVAAIPETAEDVVDAEVQPLVNGAGELF